MIGGTGNDTVSGGDSDDSIDGGTGNDLSYGGQGRDKMVMSDGNDSTFGGSDEVKLYGGPAMACWMAATTTTSQRVAMAMTR